MSGDHGGNAAPRYTGRHFGDCPDCGTRFYEPPKPYGPDALKCNDCGHDFFLGAMSRIAS